MKSGRERVNGQEGLGDRLGAAPISSVPPTPGAQPTRNPPRTAPSSATKYDPRVSHLKYSSPLPPSLDSDPTELKSRLGSFLSTPSPAPNGNLARNAENVRNSGHFRNFSLSTSSQPSPRRDRSTSPPTADKNRAIQGQGNGTVQCKGKIWS